MKTACIVSFVCVAGLLVGLPAIAKDKPDKGRKGESEAAWRAGGDRDDRKAEDREGDNRRGFSSREREQIRDYCDRFGQQEGKHPRGLPPGLAKKVARGGKLPPGWQDKCTPGEIMPAEVYRECRPLPPELVVKLPAGPLGTVTVAVEGRVVRLLEATREILDVFNVHVRF